MIDGIVGNGIQQHCAHAVPAHQLLGGTTQIDLLRHGIQQRDADERETKLSWEEDDEHEQREENGDEYDEAGEREDDVWRSEATADAERWEATAWVASG